MTVRLRVDGSEIVVADEQASLLDVVRDQCGITSVKDGCSPQGQCGCCTVLVDGKPRVACVTPVRRVADREVTTLDGLDAPTRDRWLAAFTACGASQCGFCTPGIIVRLEGLRRDEEQRSDSAVPVETVERALAAHLCRCTGWRPIIDAWDLATGEGADPRLDEDGLAGRDPDAASRRATLEGGSVQIVGPAVAAGQAGFASDTCPPDALVALPNPAGGWVVDTTVAAARRQASKVQGRRTTVASQPPLEVPEGEWSVTLRTSWVDPAYLETDASWCEPGGTPATPLANGGAFGGKVDSPVAQAARQLADDHDRCVRVLFDREDAVRLGPKRPPVAIGVRPDGTGAMAVAHTPGVVDAVAEVAPGLVVTPCDVIGPPTSVRVRGAGWVEAAVAVAAATGAESITSPAGATAAATVEADGSIAVRVACGDPLDDVVLISACTGAAHMAASWVTSESLAVDGETGSVEDLTIRSFGILKATDMPPVTVRIDESLGDTTGEAVPGGDAVFAAVALAVWRHQGLPDTWPTGVPLRSR
jgi:aerobic-type carbon monoxide dehydrogenase small subunit (CoxS/CutS family)